MDSRKVAGLVFLALAGGVILATLAWSDGVTLARLEESRAALGRIVEARPMLCAGLFFAGCVVATGLCFPAAPLIGLSAGALFGFWQALALVTAASAIGSTIAFLNARYFLRDWLRARFGRSLDEVDRAISGRGAIYLLALRLNPVIPYWVVNLAAGATAMRAATYFALTAIGLLPATLIYVHAGDRIAAIGVGREILSPALFAVLLTLSLVLLLSVPFRRGRNRG